MSFSLAAYHPQIVHFAIALLIVGVAFRLVSLIGLFDFAGPAATTLILLGTVAVVFAVKSGTDAHGPVERIPGVRQAVVDHEWWAERAHDMFLAVAALELAALALTWRKQRWARTATIVAAVAGVAGLVILYETAEHGGELVYGYAGGVGIRSGDPADVNRLFVTGVYEQALQDRQAGRGVDGANLIDMAAQRFPEHLELQLTSIEWTTDVRRDPASALKRLDALRIAQDDARLRVRAGVARATALQAQGNIDGARAVLQTLRGEFPTNRLVQQRLEQLEKPAPSPARNPPENPSQRSSENPPSNQPQR